MPGMPEIIEKPQIFVNLDALSQDRDKLKAFLTDLQTSPKDFATINYDYGVLASIDQLLHIRNDWCMAWWPKAQPVESVLRRGLIEACQVAFTDPDTKTERAAHLPLDVYWLCRPGDTVEGSVSWNARQVTVIVYTPPPPYAGNVAPTRTAPIYVVRRDPTTGMILRVRP